MDGLQRHRVFVYGTLRPGAAQSQRMAEAEWLGLGEVRGDLFRVSWYPGLVMREAGGFVKGDVFFVDQDLLEKLDEYEGGEYRRVRVAVVGDAVGVAWAWEWAGDVPMGGSIHCGDWLAEQSEITSQ